MTKIYTIATEQELEQEQLIAKLKLTPAKLKILDYILELERELTLIETNPF
jgi:Fe2+ or Zn2+ uptake regulation protein